MNERRLVLMDRCPASMLVHMPACSRPSLGLPAVILAAVVMAQRGPQRGIHGVVPPMENPVLRPEDLGSIEGEVIHASTGAKIPHAIIEMGHDSSSMLTHAVQADAQGRFTAKQLLPGRYALRARAAGYVTVRASFARPELRPGQALSGLTLKLGGGGVIEGWVIDPEGKPVSGCAIHAESVVPPTIERPVTWTRQQGRFRLTGIPGGAYWLIAGYCPDADWPFPDDDTRPSPSALPDQRRVLVPSLFPNALSKYEAKAVRVEPGGSVRGLIIRLHRRRLAAVTLKPLAGNPSELSPGVTWRRADRLDQEMARGQSSRGGRVTTLLPPGDYLLFSGEGQIPVRVDDKDPQEFAVPGPELSTIPVKWRSQGRAVGVDDQLTLALRYGAKAVLRPDRGTVLEKLPLGEFTVGLVDTPGRRLQHYLKSATWNGVDVLRHGLRLHRSSNAPLEVVLASDGGRVTGSVSGLGPATPAQVVLWPRGASRWQGHRHQDISPGGPGVFDFTAVAPGHYSVIALCSPAPYMPTLLEVDLARAYEDLALPVTVSPHGHLSVRLKCVALPGLL